MGVKIDREGDFRGLISEFTVQASEKSQALMLVFKGDLEEHWDGENWEDWRIYQFEAYGSMPLALKDGSLNQKAVDRLMDATGWNGDLRNLTDGTWLPQRCKFCVKPEEYEQGGVKKSEYKIVFLNPFDGPPVGGGLRPLDPVAANSVLAKYGPAFRGYAASRRKSTSNTQAPSLPPLPTQSTVPPTPPPVVNDDIPF